MQAHACHRSLPRRRFLKEGAAAIAAAAAGGPLLGRGASPGTVVVIGGGLAGLAAALELADAGRDVRVLEAQARTGGRVLTLREPFAGGQYADAGAARIPSSHDLTLEYVRRFDLPLVGFYPTSGRFLEQNGSRRRELGWDDYADRLSVVGLEMGGAAAWRKVDGGNDLLPSAIAKRLGERLLTGAVVQAVERRAGALRVVFARRGAREEVAAGRVVCAVPASVLGRIAFDPPLGEAKRRALEETSYASASRIFAQCRTRVWEASPSRGFAFLDGAAEVWPSTYNQPGERGILQLYLRGDASHRATAMAEPARVDAAVSRFEAAYPGVRAALEAGASKCWSEDKWARGAWAHLSERTVEELRRPEGEIHFAGEHLSRWPAWMQGAIESGRRAAREVLATAARAA